MTIIPADTLIAAVRAEMLLVLRTEDDLVTLREWCRTTADAHARHRETVDSLVLLLREWHGMAGTAGYLDDLVDVPF